MSRRHVSYVPDSQLRAASESRSWLYGTYDTCRLLNFLLLLSGSSLENRAAPELHHVGGLSSGARAPLAPRVSLARSGEPVVPALIDRAAVRMARARENRRTARRAVNQRRRTVLTYVAAVVDALLAGKRVPTAPPTGSTEVDRGVADLVAALEAVYEARADDESRDVERRVVQLVRTA